jgi:hypothetical protein
MNEVESPLGSRLEESQDAIKSGQPLFFQLTVLPPLLHLLFLLQNMLFIRDHQEYFTKVVPGW